MLLNAAIVAVSHLHAKWESKRYERSRWMIVAAMLGLADTDMGCRCFTDSVPQTMVWGGRQHPHLYPLLLAPLVEYL